MVPLKIFSTAIKLVRYDTGLLPANVSFMLVSANCARFEPQFEHFEVPARDNKNLVMKSDPHIPVVPYRYLIRYWQLSCPVSVCFHF
jgi:hypothetical protein